MGSKLVAGLCVGAAIAIAGCGGDADGDEAEVGSKQETKTEAASAKTPSHAAVLSCLKGAGVEAEDQSNSMGKKIGIDYSAGRAVISFEDSAEDAETYASVAETNGETAVAKGKVAITLPDDPEAKTQQSAVEGCVESP